MINVAEKHRATVNTQIEAILIKYTQERLQNVLTQHKKKKQEKIDRQIQEAMALLKKTSNKYGLEVHDLVEAELEREAEATLLYINRRGKGFLTKRCQRCDREFATEYYSVGYCGNPCRVRALADIGIVWDPYKPEYERWGGTPPLVVPPIALSLAKQVIGE